jgi:hypothetical protein
MKMRLGRIARIGLPPVEAEQLKSFCAGVGKE